MIEALIFAIIAALLLPLLFKLRNWLGGVGLRYRRQRELKCQAKREERNKNLQRQVRSWEPQIREEISRYVTGDHSPDEETPLSISPMLLGEIRGRNRKERAVLERIFSTAEYETRLSIDKILEREPGTGISELVQFATDAYLELCGNNFWADLEYLHVGRNLLACVMDNPATQKDLKLFWRSARKGLVPPRHWDVATQIRAQIRVLLPRVPDSHVDYSVDTAMCVMLTRIKELATRNPVPSHQIVVQTAILVFSDRLLLELGRFWNKV